MKRKLILGCVLPAAAAGVGLWWTVHAFSGAEAKPARFETVDRGDVEIKVVETGSIEPLKKVEVKSKVAGRVARLLVEEGSRVQAGQLLAEIDPTEINSQVAQIQAQLAGTRARYLQATRGVRYQVEQTRAAILQARENLHAAQQRLLVAEEESKAQPSLTEGAIAQAEASAKASQQSLDMLKESAHPQALVQASSAYDEAKAAEENARRQLERQQRLLAKGFVSQQLVDTAKTDLAAATARLQQAEKKRDLIEEQNRLEIANAESRLAQERAALQNARSNRYLVAVKQHEVVSARNAVEQARAQLQAALAGTEQDTMRRDDVAQAQASVDQLENQLRENQVHQHDTTIIAPMSGVVTKRYIEQGELVTSGVSTFSSGTPILQVSDLSRMLVRISVNEVDVQKIRPELAVELTIDAARGVVFHGRVTRVAPAAISAATSAGDNPQAQQPGSRGVIRFAVEVTVDRPDSRLKPGMSARCAIVVARHMNVLRLPADGVDGAGAKATVQVLNQSIERGKRTDTYTARPIEVGLRGDTHVEIVSGLREGERVKPGIYHGPPRKGVDLNID